MKRNLEYNFGLILTAQSIMMIMRTTVMVILIIVIVNKTIIAKKKLDYSLPTAKSSTAIG